MTDMHDSHGHRRPTLARRRLLGLLGAAALLSCWRPAAAGSSLQDALADLLGDPATARALGRAYLAGDGRREAGVRALATELDSLPAEPKTLRHTIAAASRRDYAGDRIVVVDGWVMPETEARVCALMALA
jgi:hypothetical protein